MSKISLLLMDHKENRRLLSDWLGIHYQVFVPNSEQALNEGFDLCILDGTAMHRRWEWVQTRKLAEQPVFLPFLLVTSRQDVGMATRHLWQSIDDVITTPIEKVELQARVEMLLRRRQLSVELKQRNAELEDKNQQLQQEITQHQLIQIQLRRSEEKFRTFIESAPDAVVIIDRDGRIVLVNTQTEKIFGYLREKLLGQPLEILLPERFRGLHVIQRLGYSAKPQLRPMGVGRDLFARRKDGSEFPVDISLSPIETEDGLLVTSIIRDVTPAKQAEAEIRRALEKERELNELKSRFVSMVSHEFRNPLTTISLSAHSLANHIHQMTEEQKIKYFLRIQNTVQKMTELLEDVLVISRTDTGKQEFNPAPLDLIKFCNDLVEEIQLSANEKHTIKFISCQKPLESSVLNKAESLEVANNSQSGNIVGCHPVNACQSPFFQEKIVGMDERLLRHILGNLLSNAIKYSPEGGTVYFELCFQDGEAVFLIKDQGIGIPPEDQQHLFETFHRAVNVGKIPGTGLGLTIVKSSVDLHRGKISVESDLGRGTTFMVTLPYWEIENKGW